MLKKSISLTAAAMLLSFLFLVSGTNSASAQGFMCPYDLLNPNNTPDYEKCARDCKETRNYWNASEKSCRIKGFNGEMRQTGSNAGECLTCNLTVEHEPEASTFTLIANNGWQAEMIYNSPGHYAAQGTGIWPSDWPEPYGGKNFYVVMSRSDDFLGNGDFDVDMTIQTEGTGDIIAKFHWVTNSNKNYTELGYSSWK